MRLQAGRVWEHVDEPQDLPGRPDATEVVAEVDAVLGEQVRLKGPAVPVDQVDEAGASPTWNRAMYQLLSSARSLSSHAAAHASNWAASTAV